jgi:O-antigen/teichoic acid export membrane protein
MRFGLVILGLTAPLRMLSDSHEVILGATRRFRAVANGLILKSVVALTVQVAAVVLFGFWGMFAGTVITSLALLAMWARMGLTGIRRPAFTIGMDRKALRELISYGAPILIAGQLFLIFMSIDNLLVASILDIRSLGYYALAVSVTTYVLHLPRSIGSVLAPRMAETYGRTGDELSLRGYAEDVQRLLGHVMVPLFLAAAFFGVPVLIRHALPEFTPAIPVVRIMAAGSFFIALNNMPVKTMITTGRRAALIGAIIPCLVLNVAGNYVAMAVLNTGIEGAAVATSLSYLSIFLLTGWLALRRMIGAAHTARHLGELVAVATYTIAVVWGIEELLGGSGALVTDALLAIAKMALAVVAMAPWLLRSQRLDRGPERLLELAAGGMATARRTLASSGG